MSISSLYMRSGTMKISMFYEYLSHGRVKLFVIVNDFINVYFTWRCS